MKDPLYGNKVASAILVALLLIIGLPLLAHSFFGDSHGGGHHGDEAHANPFPQFPVAIEVANAGAKPAEVVDLGALLAAATPAQGKRATAICKSCHTFTKGGANLQGPNLWNVINRPVGTENSFKAYSSALANAGGNWTYDRLDAFLANSNAYLPGTAMAQKIRKADKRAQILVYLSTLSDNPVPFPAPLPAAAEETPAGDAAADPAADQAAQADGTEDGAANQEGDADQQEGDDQ